jgi:hypothetical protein
MPYFRISEHYYGKRYNSSIPKFLIPEFYFYFEFYISNMAPVTIMFSKAAGINTFHPSAMS